jgi:hypothetical protein
LIQSVPDLTATAYRGSTMQSILTTFVISMSLADGQAITGDGDDAEPNTSIAWSERLPQYHCIILVVLRAEYIHMYIHICSMYI